MRCFLGLPSSTTISKRRGPMRMPQVLAMSLSLLDRAPFGRERVELRAPGRGDHMIANVGLIASADLGKFALELGSVFSE